MLVKGKARHTLRSSVLDRISPNGFIKAFRSSPIGLTIVELSSGHFLEVNENFLQMTGYRLEELVGRSSDETGMTSGFSDPLLLRIQQNEPIRDLPCAIKTKSGETLETLLSAEPIDAGGDACILGMIRDVTDLNRAERQRHRLLRRLINTQESERSRVARELHDEMGQHLTALTLGLKALEGYVAGSPAGLSTVEHLSQLTQEAIHRVQRIAWDLRPTLLDDVGLHAALESYVRDWTRRTGITVDFHSNGLKQHVLTSAIETSVFRIVQEALTNVIRHAQAKRVSLHLERRGQELRVIVEDDGIGFETETLMGPDIQRRLGLLGMEERAILIGGSFNIESSVGNGTSVYVRVPIGRTGGLTDE